MGDQGVDESKRATLRRFAAFGAATPLVTRSTDDDSDVRDAIVGYLASTPGAHFSKIRDDLQLGTGETQHHLRRLEVAEVVEHRTDGEYKRYYPRDRFSTFEQRALGYLRRETPRRMILVLLSNPDTTAAEIADRIDVSTAAISKHAVHMEAAGLLSREDGYTLFRPETLLTLVLRYAESFGPVAVEMANDADELLTYDP